MLTSPQKDKWFCYKHGSISQTCVTFNINHSQRNIVRRLFNDIFDCDSCGLKCSAKRIYLPWADKKLLNLSKSDECQFIINSMEDGRNIFTTWRLASNFRIEHGMDIVGKTTISNTYKKMKPLVTRLDGTVIPPMFDPRQLTGLKREALAW